MFLDENERLILLQQRTNPLTRENMALFAQAGIKTVHFSPWASWHEMEPEPGVYNWDLLDEAIDRALWAGLKASIHLYMFAPDWLPEECKIKHIRSESWFWMGPDTVCNVPTWIAINPFNKTAMEIEAGFLERACEHFTQPGVSCIYAMADSGERVLPFGMGEYTEQMCIDVVLARQRVFARYSNELWTAFHSAIASALSSIDRSTHPHVGNEHLWAIYDAMKKEFPNHILNRILYTFFAPASPWPNDLPCAKTWVGAEYAANVVEHAKMLPGLDIWGMIMAHSHEHYDPRQPFSQEYDNVAEAVEVLRSGGSYGYR